MAKRFLYFFMAIVIGVAMVQTVPFGKLGTVHAVTYDSSFLSCRGAGGATASTAADGSLTVNGLAGGTVHIEASIPVSGIYRAEFIASGDMGTVVLSYGGTEYEIKASATVSREILFQKGTATMQLRSDSVKAVKGFRLTAVSATYEAEAGQRGGYAVISASETASGGAVVSRIGGPNTDLGSVSFDVEAPQDGRYGMVLDYIPQSSNSFYVTVNGVQKIEVKQNAEGTGSDLVFSKAGRTYIEADLKTGTNRFRIWSDQNYSVDLDCVTVFSPRQKLENSYEETEAKVSGTAGQRQIYRADNGYGITGLGPDGSAEFTVSASAGTYSLRIWYSAPEYRGLEVYTDGKLAATLYCPITAEDYNIETITAKISFSTSGLHKIKFTNQYSQAPDIDKIQLVKTEASAPKTGTKGIREFKNRSMTIRYDLGTGKADFYFDGKLRVSGAESVVKVENPEDLNTAVKSSDYTHRMVEVADLEDGYGKGKKYTVVSNAVGLPTMRQSFSVYDDHPYALVGVELSSNAKISSNFMAPLTAMGDKAVDIGDIDDGRSLFVPYDNDNWVRYKGAALSGQNKSYWVTNVYDNTSRNSVVTGSVDHDTWKTGTSTYSKDGKNVNFLGSFGGIWSAQDTYDYLPHGSIDGTTISSPRMFIGYYDDWRDGMEAYGTANSLNHPMLEWKNGTPFGYNSWYGQGSKVNFEESCEVSDFMKELHDKGFQDDTGVTYVNLDSYWDNFSDDQLKSFVEKCHSNGQKAGIYWSHFVFWATDMSWKMGVPGTEYTYRDAAIEDYDGGVAAMAKDSGNLPLDPTSDAMKARLDYFMTKFVDLGFEFIKIDFLNYAAIEGKHQDPNVKTGMQAYNQALKLFTDYVDTDKFFISYSIAPLFPYQYAHARRISCDTAANIGEVSYMMNSLNYGWWQDDTLYQFADPDHLSFSASASEARTRYNSGAVLGTLMLLSDSYQRPALRELTKQLTSNEEINQIARIGKAFRPLEGNVDEWANNVFTMETEDSFYIAVFNWDNSNKTLKVNFERAGLEPGRTYALTDLWTNKTTEAQDEFSVTLMPAESTIFKIVK